MAHPAGTPSASRSLGPGVGDVPAAQAHLQVGTVLEGECGRQVPRPVLAPGVVSGPPHVGHRAGSSRNASFRAVLGYHRTPPCPVGIRHAFSCAAICDQERPSLRSPMTRSRTCSGTVRRRPILQSYPYGSRQWQGAFPLPTNTCLSRSGPVCCFCRAGRDDASEVGCCWLPRQGQELWT
jgi:hypothetical protein